jgi:hypothetical protein
MSRKVDFSFFKFEAKPYPQRYGDFLPGLSILDLAMNCGPRGIDYL